MRQCLNLSFLTVPLLLLTACISHAEVTDLKDNPLLRQSGLSLGTYEWDLYKPEHVVPALKRAIPLAEVRLSRIANNRRSPTFANTIAELEFISPELDRVCEVYYGLRSLQQEQYLPIGDEVEIILNEHSAHVLSNKRIFNRVAQLYANRANLTIADDEKRMLVNRYQALVRQGATLPCHSGACGRSRLSALTHSRGLVHRRWPRDGTRLAGQSQD